MAKPSKNHALLIETLRLEELDGAASLSSVNAAHLAKVVDEAVAAESKALAKAGEDALGHIPRLLRGPVRKVLFG